VRSRSLLWSFNFAIQGIVYALRTQRNMRLHALAAAAVLLAALYFRISGLELIALLVAISFVFIAELVNTAVESTVDLATEGFDPGAKTAKDVAAGAVLIASLNAVAVGYVVFFDRLVRVGQGAMVVGQRAPASVTLLALGLTGLLVLAVKAFNREGTFMRGGWPSGHTAVAVSLATAIGWATNSAKVFLVALFIAALVAQSRVESGTHTIPQTVFGAIIGFLVTTAIFQVFLR
jgi:diacylglycerol kinase (ATP)